MRVSEQPLKIGDRFVGAGHPCFVVAEVSANHNHSLSRAIEIVRAATQAGADAVKLQTYTADTLTIDSDREWFKVPSTTLWGGRTLHQLYTEAHTPWEWHEELFRVAREEGLVCFSTPFDTTAVAFLESLGSPMHKVASFELVDTQLLETIGRTGKPVIASVGMATQDEIVEALSALRGSGAGPIALLKCTSAYPAPPESMNLRTIPHLRATFGVVAGLSDHTMGSAVAVAAVSLGASIVEKHFTLRRADGGPDSAFSMEPAEFAQMVTEIRQAERALGKVSYERSAEEEASLCFRRSLFVVADVKAGEPFSLDNVRSIRPGHGLPPRFLPEVIGQVAAQDILRGTPLSWGLVDRRP
jgi:pseudaminic acid synthase